MDESLSLTGGGGHLEQSLRNQLKEADIRFRGEEETSFTSLRNGERISDSSPSSNVSPTIQTWMISSSDV